MNHRFPRGLSLAALLAVCLPAVADTLPGEKTLQCSVNEGVVAHTLTLILRQGELIAFDYESLNKRNGHDCGFDGAITGEREAAAKRRGQLPWETLPGGSIRIVYGKDQFGDLPEVPLKVLITPLKNGYRLSYTDNSMWEHCGTRGYLAPTVTLIKGQPRCRVADKSPGADAWVDAPAEVRP
ncbi:MAG: hypothetical protein ACREEK_00895 [Bradyrhizobium sp.]